MQIKLLAFGIAKDILNARQRSMEISDGLTIGELKHVLVAEFSEFAKLTNLSFAINETYQEDDYKIKPNDEVVIIPPVSGG